MPFQDRQFLEVIILKHVLQLLNVLRWYRDHGRALLFGRELPDKS
jgi:hypothetical protein